MKNEIFRSIFMLLLITLSGCAVTDMDQHADFRKLRTFSWGASEIEVANPLYRGDLLDRKIKTAIEHEFSRMGIYRDDQHPDFTVSYKTYTEKKQNTTPMYGGPYGYMPFGFYPFGYFPFAYGMYPYGGYPRTYTYTEGTLIIDVMDNSSHEVIWRGSVSDNVDHRNNLEKAVAKGVKAILKKYPGHPAVDERKLDIQAKPIS